MFSRRWTWGAKGEAFGATAPNQNPDGDAHAFVFDMRFQGHRYDAASGLNYNYFRDYDTGSGRYVQSDPIGLRGGISTYAYVGGNPVVWLDPYGLSGIGAGAWSIPRGIYRGLRTLGSATGLRGSDNYERYWNNHGEVKEFRERYASDRCFREDVNEKIKEAYTAAEHRLHNDNYAATYFSSRVATGLVTGLGIPAMAGDFGYYLDQGLSIDRAVIQAAVGGP